MPKYTNFFGTSDDDVLNYVGFTGSGSPNQLQVRGGDGNDKINLNGYSGIARGGEGDDIIAANHGADAIWGDEGDDLLKGQGGHDRLYGGEDNDTLLGGAGNDKLTGGQGMDELIGGNGDDIIFGDRTGSQHKDGAAFSDAFRFDTADGNDQVRDFGVGVDTVYLHGLPGDSYVLDFNGTNSFITFGNTEIKFAGVQLTASDIVLVNDGMTF